MAVCTKCGEIYKDYEVHDCEGLARNIPKWKSAAPTVGKVIAGIGAVGLVASLLPSEAMMLLSAGALMGGVWIYMILKPMGNVALDWLARHPKTFLLLHVPATVGVAMLGEGLILAFGNLLGGVVATVWLVQWGKKHFIGSNGKPLPGYVAPNKNPYSKWEKMKDRVCEFILAE